MNQIAFSRGIFSETRKQQQKAIGGIYGVYGVYDELM